MVTPDGMLFDGLEEHEPSDSLPAIEGQEDEQLERVAAWFARQSSLENRFSSALRQSIDEVLDGRRTGRYDIGSLEKTEKTYLGTKVEIVCRDEFGFPRGSEMDYRISGVDVDAKFSLTGNWMIPTEAMKHICLVMAANDEKSSFKVGLVRITEEILTGGKNKDGKRQISSAGKKAITWICESGELRENILLGLTGEKRKLIFAEPAGQRRVDQLFRLAQGRVIDRNTVETVAKQLDAPKRVRDARHRLAKDGVVILGHQKDSPGVAASLGLPIPEKGSWVSVRLVPATVSPEQGAQVCIDGSWYAVAKPHDPKWPAPTINY